jgi:histidinol-phosphate aminotransferase
MSSPYWSKFVDRLEPYEPGEQPLTQNLVKLNTNENPYGPSPKVLKAIQQAAEDDLRLYPNPDAGPLKLAIAHYYGLDKDQVFVGNGSDEVLAHSFNALLRHDLPILFADITYSFYRVYCGLYDIAYETVPLDDQLNIRADDYISANGGVVLANPNAPTGRLLSLTEIENIAKANSASPVIVDEAYIDFGGESAVTLIKKYRNLLVVQTMSKSRSLAGLRLGFAMGDKQLIEALERVKNSFNCYPIGRLSITGGIAAIADERYFQSTCARVMQTREALIERLAALGFEVLPSSANFVFIRHALFEGEKLTALLRARNVIVRHFSNPRITQYVRISIGTEQEMKLLVDELVAIVEPGVL